MKHAQVASLNLKNHFCIKKNALVLALFLYVESILNAKIAQLLFSSQ
jgi:hypothetical protein